MRSRLQKQSTLKCAGRIILHCNGEQSRAAEGNETQVSERSEPKLVSRIILRKHGYNTPQRARDKVFKAYFGVHTRD